MLLALIRGLTFRVFKNQELKFLQLNLIAKIKLNFACKSLHASTDVYVHYTWIKSIFFPFKKAVFNCIDKKGTIQTFQRCFFSICVFLA